MRARRINPEDWQDRKHCGLSILALFMYDRMKLACDSNGNFPAFCERLRSTLFPCSDIRLSELEKGAESLEKAGLWTRYEVAGETFFHVVNFKEDGGRSAAIYPPSPLDTARPCATVRDQARPSATSPETLIKERASAGAAPVAVGVRKSFRKPTVSGVCKVNTPTTTGHSPAAVAAGNGGNGHHADTDLARVVQRHGYKPETATAIEAAIACRLSQFAHYDTLQDKRLVTLVDRWLTRKKKYINAASQPDTYLPGSFCQWVREHIDDVKSGTYRL